MIVHLKVQQLGWVGPQSDRLEIGVGTAQDTHFNPCFLHCIVNAYGHMILRVGSQTIRRNYRIQATTNIKQKMKTIKKCT